MKTTAFLLVVVTSLISYSVSNNPNNTTEFQKEKWQLLNEKEFSISYPENWTLDQSGKMNSSFFLNTPFTSDDDNFSENINLMIQDLSGLKMNLDKFTELSENQIKTLVKNGVLISSKRIKNGTSSYQRLNYTGSHGQRELEWLQYYWVKYEKAYILTLTCEQSEYDNYKDVGEKIMLTFKLK